MMKNEMFGEDKVCVFCDIIVDTPWCPRCREYKGLMSIEDWEEYTGNSQDILSVMTLL